MNNTIEREIEMKTEHVLELVEKIGGDGWTVFDASDELFDNMPEDLKSKATRTYKSDGTPKGSIWKDGQIVPQMEGIYALDLMGLLAVHVDADTTEARQKMGRGFRSRALAKAIKVKLAPEKDEA